MILGWSVVMSNDTGRVVDQLVRGYKAGAYCEQIFCERLIDIARRYPADKLWASLPDDLRTPVIHWMLDPVCQVGYDPELTATESFRRFCEFLAQQSAAR